MKSRDSREKQDLETQIQDFEQARTPRETEPVESVGERGAPAIPVVANR